MPRYNVTIPLYASVVYEVEAKNKKEAIERALDEGCPTLCHQCAHEVEIHDLKYTGCTATRLDGR